MKYLIGVDGGGTHSRLLVTDLKGNVLHRETGKSTNIESNPPEEVQENFRSLFSGFCKQYNCELSDCVGICVGSAGVDNELSKQQVTSILAAVGCKHHVLVVNDAEIALAAQTKGKAGIIIISGTGSIGYGVNDCGQVWRVGGFGHLIGDEGSAYWVASRGLSASFRAMDKTSPQTIMSSMFKNKLGIDNLSHAMDFIYSTNKSEIAKLATLVVEAQQNGDHVAQQIIKQAADYFVCMTDTLVNVLEMKDKNYPLVYGGGFLINVGSLQEQISTKIRKIHPLLKPMVLSCGAEWGAIYLAAKLAKISF